MNIVKKNAGIRYAAVVSSRTNIIRGRNTAGATSAGSAAKIADSAPITANTSTMPDGAGR
jgi:hypothetical protein